MKKTVKLGLSIVLIVALLSQTVIGAFAASSKKEYVRDVVISYGNTDDEAKKWLNDNGYVYVDQNLNEGADDLIYLSKARSVYMGYKTTTNPNEAITDMKLMNMSGGYSVQDYQALIDEEKDHIQLFLNKFISAVNEFRTNYKNESPRAVEAYNILNMIKDDDTGMLMGDLLLNKINEEYTEDAFSALSAEEQKKHADMTTILMQGNAEIVLYIEKILATATDTDEDSWLDRFGEASDYDTMLEDVMDEENVTPDEAEALLSAEYNDDASLIGGMADYYEEWLQDYITFLESGEDIEDYIADMEDYEKSNFIAKADQYEVLNAIPYNDDISLLDLFLSDEIDIAGDDVYMLYPVVSVLSEGQRACLSFINGFQLVAMGLSSDSVVSYLIEQVDLIIEGESSVSVYDGVDRSIYGEDVALTGDAYRLQTSGDKDYSTNWFIDGMSKTTQIMAALSVLTIGATIVSIVAQASTRTAYMRVAAHLSEFQDPFVYNLVKTYRDTGKIIKMPDTVVLFKNQFPEEYSFGVSCEYWAKAFTKISYGLTMVSTIISGVTLYLAYQDLKEYYNSEFTPIPTWMVDQGVDENDEKIFTYYKAVECNRVEKKFTADNTKLLGNLGDINGDVGKQWLALYTTTDENAGDPILADFKVQVGSSKIPGEYTALSLFGSKSAQNLTDEKSGFTYNDSEGGIYIFYNTDTSIFAGSSITTGVCAAAAGGVVALGAVVFLIIRRKKAKKSKESEQA